MSRKVLRTAGLSFFVLFTIAYLRGAASATVVSLYGAPGTFGTLGTPVAQCQNQITVPTCESLAIVPVTGWGLDPGQSAYPQFPTMASDGTVFWGTVARTYSQPNATATDMAIQCFNPAAAVCRDDSTGTGKLFSNIRVPTFSGHKFLLPGAAFDSDPCLGTPPPSGAGSVAGADVGAVSAVTDLILGERVIFESFIGSISPGVPDSFPALGILSKTGGLWQVDSSSLEDPFDVRLSNPTLGDQVCPATPVGCCSNSQCASNNCVGAACFFTVQGHCQCSTDLECNSNARCISGTCQTAKCQIFTNLMSLPNGRGNVIGTASANHVIIDNTLAPTALRQSSMPDPCNPGTNLQLLDSVEGSDPTGSSSSDRYSVLYEGNARQGEPRQEFSYSTSPPGIVPITAPFLPTSPTHPAITCANGQQLGSSSYQWLSTRYDQHGNHWVASSVGQYGGPIFIYMRDPVTGKRDTETKCGYLDPVTLQPRPFGFPCPANYEIGVVPGSPNLGTAPRPLTQIVAWNPTYAEDPDTGSMFLIGGVGARALAGQLLVVDRFPDSNGTIFNVRQPIDLGLGLIPVNPMIDKSFGLQMVTSIQSPSRKLYAVFSGVSGGTPTSWNVCQTGGLWVYQVDVAEALASGVHVTNVSAPTTVHAGVPFDITLDTTLACSTSSDCGTSALKYNWSFLWLYLNGSTTEADYRNANTWTRQCAANACSFTMGVHGSTTLHQTGYIDWHAVFFKAGAGSSDMSMIHTIGRANIVP